MASTKNLKNNYEFYEGFEGETEIILSILEHREYNTHIWEGYIDDIFSNAPLNQKNGKDSLGIIKKILVLLVI